MIIRHWHLRLVKHSKGDGYCHGRAREWFAARGWDWAAFVREGIDSDTLLATGDGLAEAVVRAAQEAEHGR